MCVDVSGYCNLRARADETGSWRVTTVFPGFRGHNISGVPGVPGTQYLTQHTNMSLRHSPPPTLSSEGEIAFFNLPYGATSWIDFDICIPLARWLIRKCQNLKIQ